MPDLLIEMPAGFGLATIMARRGVDAHAIGARLGLVPPSRPGWTQAAHGLRLIGTGAGSWLAYEEHAPPFWAEELREQLRPVASVSDQSDGYVITRLSGERARTALRRGAAIDFHPDAFAPGAAATTVIAHIGVIVWQLDDAPTYEVATFRSYSDSFRHWLDQTAAAL